ncbi:MAG: hypothetical protein IPI41_16440 [Flavobacteriales bacterium]|nr:hypothetical protein [Flavobacteriales bacterium]
MLLAFSAPAQVYNGSFENATNDPDLSRLATGLPVQRSAEFLDARRHWPLERGRDGGGSIRQPLPLCSDLPIGAGHTWLIASSST